MAEMNVAALLEAISASPRAAGSEPEHNAQTLCASFLRSHGLETQLERFHYSAFAGTAATPIAGAVLLSMFGMLALAVGRGDNAAPALIIVCAHVLALVLVALRARGAAILHDTIMRREGANLVARSGAGEPRVWLMAHIDSKSQPVSILARSLGATLTAVAAAAMFGILLFRAAGAEVPWVVFDVCCGAGAAGSVPLLLSTVRNESRGALDNASGVAAVLFAAARLRQVGVDGFGVAITSAEELALAGAHAFAATHPVAAAINCDSIDADGRFLALGGGNSGGHAGRALRDAALSAETDLNERRRLMGILVDSVALERRGWDAVTLCRGNRASLSRIHTRKDVPQSGMNDAVEEAGSLIAEAVRRYLGAQ